MELRAGLEPASLVYKTIASPSMLTERGEDEENRTLVHWVATNGFYHLHPHGRMRRIRTSTLHSK